MKIENSDVVIVGSGVAGLICALSLDKNFKIILITKKKLKDSNSYLAQGGNFSLSFVCCMYFRYL